MASTVVRVAVLIEVDSSAIVVTACRRRVDSVLVRVLGEAEKDCFDRRVSRGVAMRGVHVEHARRSKPTQMSQRGPSAREHVAWGLATVAGAWYT